jgi:hypothetical protein
MCGSFGLENAVDVGGVKVGHRRITIGHAENASATMVVKHYKNVVIWATGDDFSAAVSGGLLLGTLTIKSTGVASKNSKNICRGDIEASVVLGNSGVHVGQNLGVVDDGSFVRILWVVVNDIIVKDNDVGIGYAIFLHHLINMVNISLMAVISV